MLTPGEAQSVYGDALRAASGNRLSWRDAYRLYREWEAKSFEQLQTGMGPYSLSLIEPAVLNAGSFVQLLSRLECSLPRRFVEDCARLSEVAWRSMAWPPVFEDVYHLAFSMIYAGSWRTMSRAEPDSNWLFRGQADARWTLAAKVFRDLDCFRHAAGSSYQTELADRARGAAAKATAVANHFGLSPNHGLAVTQHFSGKSELDVATWLVDFTFDPWTALFFASDGATSGTMGRVFCLNRGEVQERLQGVNNPFGDLTLTVPDGVPRIASQQGVFVSAAHPLFFEQFVPRYYDFHQSDGVVFEDEWMGVTRSHIYPQKDQYADQLKIVGTQRSQTASDVEVPESLYCDPFVASTYLRLLVDCWLPMKVRTWELDEDRVAAVRCQLDALAKFHASLQLRRHELWEPARSLSRLDEALSSLCQQAARSEKFDLERALSGYRAQF